MLLGLCVVKRYDLVFLYLSGLFFASLIIANSFAFKLFDIQIPLVGNLTLVLGILPYPITFLCTDLICELYGKKRAQHIVIAGFVLSLYFLFFIELGRIIPQSAIQDPVVQEHYLGVFGQSTRAILGSMVAYLLAQSIDVRLFHFFKRLTKGRHKWLRNNGSTLISQMVDTVTVTTILFYDKHALDVLITLVLTGYAFKLIIALIDTPLFYLGSHYFKDIEAETLRRRKEGAEPA